MKKLSITLFFFVCSLIGLAQTITTEISYQNIPVWGSTAVSCLFNMPPGTPPFQIAGLNHYPVSGGVNYSGNELKLLTYASGLGTAFGIFYPFKQNNKYKIEIEASELTPSGGNNSRINIAINNALTHASTTCSPEFPGYISAGAVVKFSTPALVFNSYQVYTVVDNFTPTVANLNYLLIAGDQYGAGGGNHFAGIKKITITETLPQCNLSAPTGLTTSNNSTILNWNAVNGANSYKVIIDNVSNGILTLNTFFSNTNSLQYCAQYGDNISYKVQGVCSNTGLGITSNVFNYSFPIGLVATSLTAIPGSNRGTTGYYIHFSPIANVENYLIDWFDITTNSMQTQNISIAYSTENIDGNFYYYLTQGHTYKFRIHGSGGPCGTRGYSDWSTPITFAPSTCASPTNLSFLNMGGGNVKFSWSSATSAQYEIQYNLINISQGLNQSFSFQTQSNPANYNIGIPNGMGWTIGYRVRVLCTGTIWSNWSSMSPQFAL